MNQTSKAMQNQGIMTVLRMLVHLMQILIDLKNLNSLKMMSKRKFGFSFQAVTINSIQMNTEAGMMNMIIITIKMVIQRILQIK